MLVFAIRRWSLRLAAALLLILAGQFSLAPGAELPVLVLDPWSAIRPASQDGGPQFLSVAVGRTVYGDAVKALGPPTHKDGETMIWRGTEQCRRHDLSVIVVHFPAGKAADWIELVLHRRERPKAVAAALRLPQATGSRQEGRWLVQEYKPTGIELVLEGGEVGTIKLVSHARAAQAAPAGGLFKAAADGNVEEVQRLIDAGADVRSADESGRTALHFAALNGHTAVVEALIAAAFGRDEQGQPVVWPGLDEMMHAQDPNQLADMQNRLGALSFDSYLDKTSAAANARDKRGQTPLHLAAGAEQFDVVSLLLAKDAEVDPVDDGGQTPLHLAAAAGDDAVVAVLLSHGADPRLRDRQGRTPRDLTTSESVKRRIDRALKGSPPPSQPPVDAAPVRPMPPSRDSGEALPLGPIELRNGTAAAPLEYRSSDKLGMHRLHGNVAEAASRIVSRFPEAASIHIRIVVEGTELYRFEGDSRDVSDKMQSGAPPEEIVASMKRVEVTPWQDVLKSGLREAAAREASVPNRPGP